MARAGSNPRTSAVPTEAQQRILKQLQNVIADLGQQTGSPIDRQVMRDLYAGAQALEEQAREVGIPDRWITHISAQARAGHRWRAWQQLPAGVAEARDQQLARGHAQVDQLYEMSAVVTIYRARGGRLTALAVERFDENQRALWLRVRMVTAALNITSAEIGARWATDSARWTALLQATASMSSPELLKRWKSYTSATALVQARARYHVLSSAGLKACTAPAPPSPQHLNHAAETAWRDIVFADDLSGTDATSAADRDRGTRIAHAVDAAVPERSRAHESVEDDLAAESRPESTQLQPEIEP